MDRPCTGCIFWKLVNHPAHRTYRDRCFRPRTMRNGAVIEAGMNGFDGDEERDAQPAPTRQDGDKCGPAAKWWGAEL